MTEDEIRKQIKLLQEQQSMQTNAIRAALEGRWSDQADSVDGWVKALNPDLQTAPKRPLYP